MTDDRPAGGRTVSLSALRRHDRLCSEFEARWGAGVLPRIEDFLAAVPEEEHSALFEALLRVELELRPVEDSTPDDYHARFPEYAATIDAVFHDPDAVTELPGARRRAPLAPPDLPGYDSFRQLGAGGMGVVYRARDIVLDRPVAVKVIGAGAQSQPEELRRFHIEARSVAGLNHPNIVQLYAYGHVDGTPYYVMEFLETGSLAARLKGLPAEPPWAAELVETLASAVQYIHDQQIVHRD